LATDVPLVIVVKAVQDVPGVAVGPVRTLTVRVVPDGTVESHESASQATVADASKTREVKVPEVA